MSPSRLRQAHILSKKERDFLKTKQIVLRPRHPNPNRIWNIPSAHRYGYHWPISKLHMPVPPKSEPHAHRHQ
jgi:hypothetical protein